MHENFEKFLADASFSYKEENLTHPGWVEQFWQKVREFKIAKGDYNFTGFVFPYFDLKNFNEGKDRWEVPKEAHVYFYSAQFKGRADFSSITFNGIVNFDSAVFHHDVKFTQVYFKSAAYFEKCDFRRGFQFWGAFYDDCSFANCEFSKEYKSTFVSVGDDAVFHDTARFTGVIFPETFSFLYCNLEIVSFSGAYLRKLNMNGCKFQQKGNRLILHDEEKTFERRGTGITAKHFIHLEDLYRQLKANFEEKKDYSLANKFYVSEMEMRRRRLLFDAYNLAIPSGVYYKLAWDYKPGNWKQYLRHRFKKPNWKKWKSAFFERVLITAYWIISDYGQSASRIFLWMLTALAGGVTALLAIGHCPSDAVLTIFKALTFQQDTTLNDASQWVVTLMRLASAILVPLFILSLRRIFKR